MGSFELLIVGTSVNALCPGLTRITRIRRQPTSFIAVGYLLPNGPTHPFVESRAARKSVNTLCPEPIRVAKETTHLYNRCRVLSHLCTALLTSAVAGKR
jgi:hypothetical protein